MAEVDGSTAPGGAADDGDDQSPLVGALLDVTIASPSLHIAEAVFADVLGMEADACGPGRSGAHAHQDASGRIYRAPGWDHGAVRVVPGEPREVAARPTAGWDCVELSVADVEAIATKLQDLDVGRTIAGPLTVDLSSHDSAQHRSVVWLAPWGTHLILTQGLTQPVGRTFPAPAPGARCGPVFEVHLRAPATARAASPYRDLLGMRAIMGMDVRDGPIHEVWGLPSGARVEMTMLTGAGTGTGEGALEIQSHDPDVLEPLTGGDGCPGGTCTVAYACPTPEPVGRRLADDGLHSGPSDTGVWIRGRTGEVLELRP